MSLGLSIPLYNEADGIGSTTRDLMRALTGVDAVVVLVNNGSTDDTPARIDALAAEHPHIRTLHLFPNAGYGGGILAGVHALLALPSPPDVIGWMWGDNQIDPTILPKLYTQCTQGAALAKARRTVRQDGWQRRLITTGYAATMRWGMGCKTPDVNGCPKLFQRDILTELQLSATDWFLDAEAILKLEARQHPIAWEDTTMRPRTSGVSKVKLQTITEFARNLALYRRQ